MNLADPELELIDPTPNVHSLFIQFDKMFFWTKLASRAVVKWSKRMYSCAGVCSYEGRGGLCNISLSEPLLKLRPRKDLVETLLHEMIHAFLFVTSRDQDRDGHGPNFKAHMYRINSAAGLNISIYHDFHDEVELYQTHWWRCNGPCQRKKPHYGIVRRSTNRVPGPSEYWWADHLRQCGGTFIKFKEPEKTAKKTIIAKPKGDITKYVKTTKNIKVQGEPKIQVPVRNKVPARPVIKSNSSSTVVVTNKIFSAGDPVLKQPSVFNGKGNVIRSRERSSSVDAAEVVRNVWANKNFTSFVSPIAKPTGKRSSRGDTAPNSKKVTKHKADSIHADSPPVKVKKIDDYFKTTANALLKDIYGEDIEIAESNNSKKFIAVYNTGVNSPKVVKVVKVDCPICIMKVDESYINDHLDECLNKDIISKLSAGNDVTQRNISEPYVKSERPIKVETKELLPVKNEKSSNPNPSKPALKEILYNLPPIPACKVKLEDSDGDINHSIVKKCVNRSINTSQGTFRSNSHVGIIKELNNTNENINWKDILKHDIPETRTNVDFKSSFIPPFGSEDARPNKLPPVQLEPGSSSVMSVAEQKCPCCGDKVTKALSEHLDECLAFFVNSTDPEEGASTSFANKTIVIDDDDDELDETQQFNETGTKLPCPCCLQMVENDDMNAHLDNCLS